MDKLTLAFVLMLVYQEKHYYADFPLQNWWMLGKFHKDWGFPKRTVDDKGKASWELKDGFVLPLAVHCGVHALMTFAIVTTTLTTCGHSMGSLPWTLAAIDFIAHFVMDRIKASPKLWGRYKSLCSHDFIYKKSMTEERWLGKVKSNTHFWRALGRDQEWHSITHIYIIWRLIHGL